MGNVWGVTVGAVLLAWLNGNGLKQIGVQIDDWFGTSLEGSLPRYNYIILGVLLVLMMLFRREGLIPEKRTKALMHTANRDEMNVLGADITEAGVEDYEFQEADAEADAELVASATELTPQLGEEETRK
jgi:branched-chain amino acid transport system permease protein